MSCVASALIPHSRTEDTAHQIIESYVQWTVYIRREGGPRILQLLLSEGDVVHSVLLPLVLSLLKVGFPVTPWFLM